MITLPPYILDRDVWAALPAEHRWCMNKLELALRLGYKAGPSGTFPGVRDIVVRPIMNFAGMGTGGVFERSIPVNPQNQSERMGSFIQDRIYAGHFWVEKFAGKHQFVEYIDDVAVASTRGTMRNGVMIFSEVADMPPLPDILKGISRYSLGEFVGTNLVEYSARHISTCARQSSIDDYKQFDPDYDPVVQFGIVNMIKIPFEPNGFSWEDDESSRKPWVMYS